MKTNGRENQFEFKRSIFITFMNCPSYLFAQVSINTGTSELGEHGGHPEFADRDHSYITLKSVISMEFFLFFLRKISQLHALSEPPRLFIFGEKSHLHNY